MWSIAFLRGKTPACLRMMLWTSMRTATTLGSMSGWGRSGYGPPLSRKVVSGFIMCSAEENLDSDADLDMDGDDTLYYGKPQYMEAYVISSSGEESGEAKERERHSGSSPKWRPSQHTYHTLALNGPVMRCHIPAAGRATSRRLCKRPSRIVTLRR